MTRPAQQRRPDTPKVTTPETRVSSGKKVTTARKQLPLGLGRSPPTAVAREGPGPLITRAWRRAHALLQTRRSERVTVRAAGRRGQSILRWPDFLIFIPRALCYLSLLIYGPAPAPERWWVEQRRPHPKKFDRPCETRAFSTNKVTAEHY